MTDERAWRRGSSGVEGNVRTAAIWSQVRALSESRQSELSRPLRVLDLGEAPAGWPSRSPSRATPSPSSTQAPTRSPR
uniref:Uncharacterized protein n=1 Tax=Janibacter limosus TaxID=53458 RepID=A0AC61U7R7_9MICO|nr:hypothetical protein [Janibacter limosus]